MICDIYIATTSTATICLRVLGRNTVLTHIIIYIYSRIPKLTIKISVTSMLNKSFPFTY